MIDNTWYFGRPGHLRPIHWPKGGVTSPRTVPRSVFRTGAGGARMSQLVRGVRTYSLNYEVLGAENFNYIDSFAQGMQGPGPFVLLDPGRRNMLETNQSASTSVTNDEFGFTASVASIFSTTEAANGDLFSRSLAWSFPSGGPATPTLSLDVPALGSWPGGIPVYRRPHSFSFTVYGGTGIGDGAVEVGAKIQWTDAAGANLTSATGTLVTSSAGVGKQVFVTATPPSTAVFCKLSVVATSGTIAANDYIVFNEFMLNEGNPDQVWSPGTGVFPVGILGVGDQTPYLAPDFRRAPVMTLQELR